MIIDYIIMFMGGGRVIQRYVNFLKINIYNINNIKDRRLHAIKKSFKVQSHT